MKAFLRDLFTGRDGQTFDLGRVLWASCVVLLLMVGLTQLCGMILGLWNRATLGTPWSSQDWGIWAASIGAQLPFGASAIALKASTEPKPGEKDATAMRDDARNV